MKYGYLEFMNKVRLKQDPNWCPPKRLLALDPGETTGYSVWEDGRMVHEGQWASKLEGREVSVYNMLTSIKPTAIIMEDYRVYAHKAKDHKNNDLFTAKLIGNYELMSFLLGIPIAYQMASNAKGFVTDTKLKQWGIYDAGQKHCRDSMRHALYFLICNKEALRATYQGVGSYGEAEYKRLHKTKGGC